LHRRAEEGDELAQFRLGNWFFNNGHLREALKYYAPLAEAGDDYALGMLAEVLLSLARTDSRCQPLEELLQVLPQDADGATEARDRARRALRDAQEKQERRKATGYTRSTSPDPVPIDLGDAAVILGAATAVPFVHAIATQAGSDIYAWARQLFGRAVGRESQELTERTIEAALHVVGDSTTNTWLEMRGRPTDEALAKLAETDLETLATPDRRGRAVIVCWVPEAGEWQRRVQEPGAS
jgi:hypothetical protein